jgi:hypothetical protein
MLDFFLVLGRVPGTNFFITFNEFITTVSAGLSIWIYFYHYYWIRQLWRSMRLGYLWVKVICLQGTNRLSV